MKAAFWRCNGAEIKVNFEELMIQGETYWHKVVRGRKGVASLKCLTSYLYRIY
jgi:hypothetical protein